jgi:hypothetical protein
MRLTSPLNIAITNDYYKWLPRKLFWGFGKGFWGPRKTKYCYILHYKLIEQRLGLRVHTRSWEDDNRPPGTVPIDANQFAAVDLYPPNEPLQHPWPFHQPEYVPGSRDDPHFKQRPAQLYNKYMTLYEGIKGASNFTNAIIESEESLPEAVKEVESRISIDEKSLERLDRSLHWTKRGDSILNRMPKNKIFPRLNYNNRREFNIHPLRKDVNILRSYQSAADLLISTRYGFVDRRIVDWPHVIVPFERDGQLCVLDLKTEFVTTSAALSPESSVQGRSTSELPVFDRSPESTIEKSLIPIAPVDWSINFDETNFYPDPETWGMRIQPHHQVQTIFLCNNNTITKPQPDRFVKGRSVLYMYSMAASRARDLYGTPDPADPVNYTDLPKPVTIQCMHYNITKNNVIFLAFQLNTLSFNEEKSLKNQIWTEGPFDADADREVILKKLVALNLMGSHESVLQNVN